MSGQCGEPTVYILSGASQIYSCVVVATCTVYSHQCVSGLHELHLYMYMPVMFTCMYMQLRFSNKIRPTL